MGKESKPRILLTTGIFYPDVGGPATHVRRIAEHFSSLAWRVTVVAFGDAPSPPTEPYRVVRVSRRMPKPIMWLTYAFVIFREVARTDLAYAFDLTTAGLPSACAARFFGKPFLLRIGGDPIWERVVEKGKRFLPMRSYYEQQLFRVDRPLLYRSNRFVVHSAQQVVTYCEFLKEIYVTFYGLDADKVVLIRNPFPTKQSSEIEKNTSTFIFAGRFVAYKNLSRVIHVFKRIHTRHPQIRLLLIGDGPDEALIRREMKGTDAITLMPKVDQKTLFTHIKASSVALAPALTEFNPNFILESLALGKPALISIDNGLSVELPHEYQFDPMSDESLEATMERLCVPEAYAAARKTVENLPFDQTWESVVGAHENLVRGVLEG